jgi:SpoIID/LytB domain protein
VPLPARLQNQAVSRWWLAALVACSVTASGVADETTVRVSINGRTTRLGLEEYVARVVAGEGQPAAASGAQQALAITARTYAIANLSRHRREGFDLCDSTHCQVLRPATAITRRAAQATAGRVLLYQGQAASVFYSALCGGHSELASQVWPGADDSSSDLHEDDACRDEPGWSSEFRNSDIERALRNAGHRGSRLRDLRIVQRNQSGRVARIRVVGFTPDEISGTDFRAAMSREAGFRNFKSTAFDVQRVGSTYRFSGTGFGHGVGLCVIGAGHRAARGVDVHAILRFYFPNLSVGMVSTALAARAAPAKKPAPSPTASARAPALAATDVVVAPGVNNDEQVEVLRLVRSARDDIAKLARVQSPPTIRVTVHTSVDAFVRATGQPWWVSGASDGTQIDLAPLALLRQRAQFERTIRREVARAMIDAALKNRPMWVREGAVAYLAEPLAAEAATRGSCPKDAELLRPDSAGAHRTALARAEACFRREIAKGRSWRDVR